MHWQALETKNIKLNGLIQFEKVDWIDNDK